MNAKYCVMCRQKLWEHPVHRIKVGEMDDGSAAEICPKCAKKYADHLLKRAHIAEMAEEANKDMEKRLHTCETPLAVPEEDENNERS